jgi:hypothetical protein
MTILQGGTRNVLTKSNLKLKDLVLGILQLAIVFGAFNYLGVAKSLQLMTIFMLLYDRVPKTF